MGEGSSESYVPLRITLDGVFLLWDFYAKFANSPWLGRHFILLWSHNGRQKAENRGYWHRLPYGALPLSKAEAMVSRET